MSLTNRERLAQLEIEYRQGCREALAKAVEIYEANGREPSGWVLAETSDGSPDHLQESFDDLAERYRRGFEAGHVPSLTRAVESYTAQGLPLPGWVVAAVGRLVDHALSPAPPGRAGGRHSQPLVRMAAWRRDYERWRRVQQWRVGLEFRDPLVPSAPPPDFTESQKRKFSKDERRRIAAIKETYGDFIQDPDGSERYAVGRLEDVPAAALHDLIASNEFDVAKAENERSGQSAEATHAGWERVRDAIDRGEADCYFAVAERPLWEWPAICCPWPRRPRRRTA